jgi:ABC-type dipeptide transport system, periplasmic component
METTQTDSVISSGISVYEDVDTFIYNYYHSNATSGLSHLSDADLDAQITKARALVNDADRVKAYIDIQKYLADKMYTVAGFASGQRLRRGAAARAELPGKPGIRGRNGVVRQALAQDLDRYGRRPNRSMRWPHCPLSTESLYS